MNLVNILLNATIAVNIFNNTNTKEPSITTSLHRPKRDLEFSEPDCSKSLHLYGYTVSKVKPNDVNQAMDLLRRTFFVDEPLNKAINLCPGGTGCPELEEFCRQDLTSGYSLKATDNNGKIIAIIISGMVPLKEKNDGNDIKSQAKKMRNPKFQKILYILANREAKAKLWEKFPHEKNALDIKIVATDRDWRHKGIMSKLISETEHVAKHNYVSLLRMDSSNFYSARGAKKLGFKNVYSILYSDLKMNGEPIILPEKPHVEDCVMVKQLDAPKIKINVWQE